jgi:prefoldin subunit 5
MSRQEQLRKDRKLRRDRGMVLKQMGFNDEATAYLASNDYTFNMGKGLYDTVAERRKSGQYMDINDFYDVKYNKPVHSLDVQKGTKSAKPTINLQEFYKGDMDQNLDFFVEFVNQKGLADPQSFDDILAEKTELFKKAMLDKSNADSDANMPQGRKDEIKGTVEKLQNEITNLYHSKQKSDAFITALQPAAGVDSDLYFKTVEKVEADTARVFNMFKQSPAEAAEKFGKIVNLPQEKMQSVFANLAMGNNGLITGGTAEQRIKAYNILRKSTVESYIQTIAQLDGKKATVDALKKHFSEYRTTEPELVYTQSEAFIDGKPTFKYYEYLKQQLEKRGGNTFEIMIPTQGDFGFRTITKEEVDEYGAYFESLMAGP